MTGGDAAEVLSIGHSTRSAEELGALLAAQGVGTVADVRRFPGSRRHPQFGQEALRAQLRALGIRYAWLEALGGRRGKGEPVPAPSAGLRNASFRRYGDYMQTAAFAEGLAALQALARERPTALLCSEAVYWRCHRRLIADALWAQGIVVRHILSGRDVRPHQPTPGACFEEGRVTYPAG